MTTTPQCPQCSAPLAADAPQGLCPQCLARVGLGTGSETKASTKPPGAAPDLAEIAKHFPQLDILEFIGAGGMGTLYKARQKQLDRVIALKILPTESSRDPSFAERFLREARALAKLNHPNIVTVYEFGEADGLFFLIMEYVDGANLRQMERAGQLTPAEALAIVPKICDALQYAHDEGVVHRDIKPENILVDKKGRVKLVDFGLAKLLGKERKDFTLTGTSQAMGTPQYMAPEQIEHPLSVDHRADIYSLGVVFYEMLTGELPMGRFALPSQTLHVDVRLDEVVLKTLEKEPDRRYQHVSEVKSAVESVVSQPPVTAKSKYRPAVLIPVGLGVVLIVALVWWLVALTPGKSSVSALTWRTTLTKAETAYDENRFEEAIGLFDAALAAINADQKADPSVLKIARDKARKDRELAGFILDRSKLPLSQQIELTQQKLAEFNTNYTGKGTFTPTKEGQIVANLEKTGITDLTPLKGLPLTDLNLYDGPVADLSPLRGMKLEGLNLADTRVPDLALLKGMHLKRLYLWRNPVVDLGPLRGMTSLTDLGLGCPGVRDLSPLQGMQLKYLAIPWTKVTDLSVLQGMPLAYLDITKTPVTDLRPLKGMPLVELRAEGVPVTDLSPLRTLKALAVVSLWDAKPLLNDLYTALRTNDLAQAKKEAAALIADCQSVPAFSNVVAEAREIQTALAQLANGDTGPYAQYWLKHLRERGIAGNNGGYSCETNGLLTLNLTGLLLSNVTLDALHYVPLREVVLRNNNLTNLQALAGLPLKGLDLFGSPVADLSPLRGMKLEFLGLGRTTVADLAPLTGMPLKSLYIDSSKVVDLSPLKGMTSLTSLDCSHTGVGDVGPLQGMRLTNLNLWGAKVSDLAPLKGMPLEHLDLYESPVGDFRPLLGMPLKWLHLSFSGNVTDILPLQGMPLVELVALGLPVTDVSPLRTLKSLAVLGGIDSKPLLTDLYTALRTNDLAQAKKEAASLIADCQSAPAFAGVVAEAREIQTALAQLAQGDTGPYSQYWLKHLKERGIVKNNGYWCYGTNGLIALNLDGCLASSNVTLDAVHYLPLRDFCLQDKNLTNVQALAGLPLTGLYLRGSSVVDLSPLRGMKLESLDLVSSQVSDLAPLQGMPLVYLNISHNPVSDLRPLKGMRLQRLEMSDCPMTDISLLEGMPLTSLGANNTGIADLSPLAGMPLETLNLWGATNVTSIAALRGMKLTNLSVGGTKVSDVTVLQGMPLKELWLQSTRVARLPSLDGMPLTVLCLDGTPTTNLPSMKGVPLIFLSLRGTKISDLSPVAGLLLREIFLSDTPVADLSPLKGAPLTRLDASRTKVSDLTPLKSAPLDFVAINYTPVSDLSPLANAPIRELFANSTLVRDLTQLKNAPLVQLQFAGTPVSNLSPLAGISSLRWIFASGTSVTDLSPLKGLSLSAINIGGNKITDLSPLKGMKSLTGIEGFDIAGLLLADLRRAVEVKDNAAVKTLASKIIADWQDVPAMADVVKQAKEMLGAAGGTAAEKTTAEPQTMQEGFFTCTTNNGVITITKYTGTGGDVTIPSAIKGQPVTSIGQSAFFGCGGLTNVTIPDSVTTIGDDAFWGCGGLTNITIPKSVTSIGISAFAYCGKLTKVTIPVSVTSLGANPFAGCTTAIFVDAANPAYSSSEDGVLFNKDKTCLVAFPGDKAGSYQIPSGVSTINGTAFYACQYLTIVTVPESVTRINEGAFCKCGSLTGIYFKGDAPWVGNNVFQEIKKATIYFRSGTTGWGKEFGGRPTAVWNH